MPATTMSPAAHPMRVALHNEIHARPPEAMGAPLALSNIVMVCDAAQREASRGHLAQLLRDHHLPLPDAGTTHLRLDVGTLRVRWELHTEFVSWTFSRSFDAKALASGEPPTAAAEVPRDWLAALPGQWLAGMHLWVLPSSTHGDGSLVGPVLNEETLVASTVADGHGEV